MKVSVDTIYAHIGTTDLVSQLMKRNSPPPPAPPATGGVGAQVDIAITETHSLTFN